MSHEVCDMQYSGRLTWNKFYNTATKEWCNNDIVEW